MVHSEQQQVGLEWVRTLFSGEPRWTVDLDLDNIKCEIEKALGRTLSNITFLAQGAFNKLYTVQSDDEVYIMRVTLPVDPRRKTASEVATIAWIRKNTAIPVPEIIAFKDHSHDNGIGFEWILMTKIPGKTLADAWRHTSLEAKQGIVRQLATYLSTLFDKQGENIGNLYPTDPNLSLTSSGLGEVVSLEFLWANRPKYGVSRGPFRSSRDWLAARLSLLEKENQSTIENPESPSMDEDDVKDAHEVLEIIQRLRKCLDLVFPSDPNPAPEPSILHHDDLTQSNIMIDDDDNLSGVIDWECVSWVPLWKACYYPTFLVPGRTRNKEPDINRYRLDEQDEPSELYWEHLEDYELTVLRRDFFGAMRDLRPEWAKVFEESWLRRSFEFAVVNCDDGFLTREISEWIEDLLANGVGSGYDLVGRHLEEQASFGNAG